MILITVNESDSTWANVPELVPRSCMRTAGSSLVPGITDEGKVDNCRFLRIKPPDREMKFNPMTIDCDDNDTQHRAVGWRCKRLLSRLVIVPNRSA